MTIVTGQWSLTRSIALLRKAFAAFAFRRAVNPKSGQFLNAVCVESLKNFRKQFVTLGELANRYRRVPGPLSSQLEAKGVCPIEIPRGVSWYFDRWGLARRLKKLGIHEL